MCLSDFAMVNLITEKSITTSSITSGNVITSATLPQNPKPDITAKKTPDNGNFFEKHQKLLSAGLITGGGLLLYYGLTRPGKPKLFEEFIKNKIFNMEIITNRYRTFVNDIIETSFAKTAEHIANFKKTYFLNPSESVIQIKMLTDPKKIADAQDLAFDAILNINRSRNKAGASEFGQFSSKFTNVMQEVKGKINREKHRTTIELDDYLHLPKLKEEIPPDQVEEAESRLIAANRSLDIFMSELRDTRLNAITKEQYTQMADALVYCRHLQTKTKENIINTAFEKIKRILKLGDDFVPLYNRGKYNIGKPEEIAQYLKPQKIPERIKKQTETNVYMEVLQKHDLREMSPQKLKYLFHRIPYTNNLKDLRYLIDRYRLRYAIALAEKSDNAQIYERIIVKLEYLSNELSAFGKGEVLDKCSKDFDKMTVEQRKYALYDISTTARRLGYESFEQLDKELYKTSDTYKNSNLHSYMPIIKSNPALYFIG